MTIAHKNLPPRLALLVLMAVVPALHAQVTTTAPIKVRQPGAKIDSFRGEVVNWTPAAITVRDARDAYKLRTFTFDSKLVTKVTNRYMEKGSRVTVKYQHMTDTAVGLQGRILRQP